MAALIEFPADDPERALRFWRELLDVDLSEPFAFLDLLQSLDIQLVNITVGSPYYNPHIQRPALFPPSDGYQPPEDPLVGVARQIAVTRAQRSRRGGAGWIPSASTIWVAVASSSARTDRAVPRRNMPNVIIDSPNLR